MFWLQPELEQLRHACKKMVSRLSSRRLLVLWEEDQIGHGQTRGQLPPGTRTGMALPRVVVHHMERYTTRLYGPLTSGTCSAGIRENRKSGKMDPNMDCQASDVERHTEPAYFWSISDVLLFSECGHPLVHHYRVLTKGISHVSLRGSYLDNLQTFITHSEAMGQWGQDKDTAQLSTVHRGSASPRSIRQRDSDEESPRCKARGARSNRKMDVPAVPMSPTSVSSRDLRLLIYDGQPAILPVSIRMADLVGDDVVVSVDLPSVIAPPVEDGVLQAGPTSTRDSEPAVMSEFSSDTDPDLEDELCRFQPLQAAVSPLSTTSIMGVMTSPSRYPAPVVPPCPPQLPLRGPIREEYSPGTLDVFPTYVPSPDISLYVLVTSPVTPVQPLDIEFLSPGGPASIDNLLAGDSSLMDRDQNLPLLPLPLLPLPNHFGLLQDTASVVGLSQLDTGTCPGRGLLMYTAPHQTQGTSR